MRVRVRVYVSVPSYVEDVCARHGVSTEDVYRSRPTEALRNAVHEVASAGAFAHSFIHSFICSPYEGFIINWRRNTCQYTCF